MTEELSTEYGRYRSIKKQLQNNLFTSLDNLHLQYDNYYWMNAKNDIDALKRLLNYLYPDIQIIVSILEQFQRNCSRFLASITRQIKAHLPHSRREFFNFEFADITEWKKGVDAFLEGEIEFITKKRELIENSYIRPVDKRNLHEALKDYQTDSKEVGFDLKSFGRHIEKFVRPMDYPILQFNDALMEINNMISTTIKIEELCAEAPASLLRDIPHILSDYLPDEALHKLRKTLNVDSSKEFSAIPDGLLTFNVFRKFLTTEKTVIPTHMCQHVVIEKDLEKYAGSRILARKTAVISLEEATELIKSGKASKNQLYPLVPPYDPEEIFQNFEIKQYILLSEDEKYVNAKSTTETEELQNFKTEYVEEF